MTIVICIGSSCHIKGSRLIVQDLQMFISEHHLTEKVELSGSFCMGNCVEGVSVKINGQLFSLKPENTRDFFYNEVLRRLNNECNRI